ncbi:siroheme synthase CysG [Methylocapsa acidiphila]|uniref:siroheme synthase CysG n=1 Tax=Methylocapsa acidiphila TaxID=133552 RepID=UPI000411D537|nr:siroheme synthase CysG [Methylocapsa acidiphila]
MKKAEPPRSLADEELPLARGLASVPVFFGLEGKRAVVAGGSKAALWKAELLHAAGAELDIYSPDPCAELCAFVERVSGARLVRRPIEPEDLRGAALAIADVEGEAQAENFKAMAKAAGAPANIIDKPAFSDFQFGAIVDRSPLVIGISTGGGAPVLAQALRGRLEAMLPHKVKFWAGAAKDWRRQLKGLDLPASARRRFWELFSARTLDAGRSAPEADDFSALLDAARAGALPARTGSVALVGAGPGDPELLTLKALRVLQSADVVLFDDLVAPGVVEMARREAERISVGKRGYRPSCRQEHIVSLMMSLAASGKRVVRLKGGDPMIFGRANEEIAALRAAGIPVEVVPGVTAALGAAASLKISLTERDRARRVQFITAHAHDGKLPEDIDWRSLCDPRASSVVYMGLKTLGVLSARLLAQGLDPSTPALLVERATWPDERSVAGTIADLPGKVLAEDFSGPCVILIGAFAAQQDALAQQSESRADGAA